LLSAKNHFLESLMREQLLRDIEQLIPVLRRYALFLVRDSHGTDDLVQDCLERAVRHLDQFRAGTNLRAWLLTIMRNCFLDGRRREKGQIHVAWADLPREPAWSPARQEHHILIQELRQAFLLLPDQQKLAMICIIFEGLSYDDAAEVLGVSVGTIKSRVSRGREALRRAAAAEPLRRSA
jgi:RNA polymerase sigma factor (sigma-70 family)